MMNAADSNQIAKPQQDMSQIFKIDFCPWYHSMGTKSVLASKLAEMPQPAIDSPFYESPGGGTDLRPRPGRKLAETKAL